MPRSSRAFVTAISSGVLLAVACVWPTDVCGCPPEPIPTFTVIGKVIDRDNRPVVDAGVHIHATRSADDAGPQIVHGIGRLTDEQGKFRATVAYSGDPENLWLHPVILVNTFTDTIRLQRIGPVHVGAFAKSSMHEVRVELRLP